VCLLSATAECATLEFHPPSECGFASAQSAVAHSASRGCSIRLATAPTRSQGACAEAAEEPRTAHALPAAAAGLRTHTAPPAGCRAESAAPCAARSVPGECPQQAVDLFRQCIEREPERRPSASEVVLRLEQLRLVKASSAPQAPAQAAPAPAAPAPATPTAPPTPLAAEAALGAEPRGPAGAEGPGEGIAPRESAAGSPREAGALGGAAAGPAFTNSLGAMQPAGSGAATSRGPFADCPASDAHAGAGAGLRAGGASAREPGEAPPARGRQAFAQRISRASDPGTGQDMPGAGMPGAATAPGAPASPNAVLGRPSTNFDPRMKAGRVLEEMQTKAAARAAARRAPPGGPA